jgi:hypothetical protein
MDTGLEKRSSLHENCILFKGIVSRDWGDLLMTCLNRNEVQSISASSLYFIFNVVFTK